MKTAGDDMETTLDEASTSIFEELYISVRRQERRIVSDGELMFLPDVDVSHVHYNEWLIRKRSSMRLITYLQKKKRALKILEIGCGNGWLSSRISAIPHTTVIGLDINEPEINQAKRVFKKDNLDFLTGTFTPELFAGEKFNIILFAASIQYFSSLKDILQQALHCLTEHGEIHIVDSHFYEPSEVKNAAARCLDYYTNLGFPEMAGHYFHHSTADLLLFNCTMLINPGSLINRISKKEPFYWIAIKN
ncbi:methyltransferase domain-containing protein [uncultured Mucilaginibacter sp.]|uniref:class I SAM-dependent methyltransferase n=1 Tax=uncultured Mucilaginibacter sp. TaxID=797541 RepID=UPI0025DCF621|nr:methyltransferase domain-containing protein [uncultured Mucilaginibacter sp.]